MEILFTILAILVIIASILVTVVVLLQNGKGGGLASNFVAGNQTFGVRQTADILEKITWGLAIVILVLAISTNFVPRGNGVSTDKNSVDASILEKTTPAEETEKAFSDAEKSIQLQDAPEAEAEGESK